MRLTRAVVVALAITACSATTTPSTRVDAHAPAHSAAALAPLDIDAALHRLNAWLAQYQARSMVHVPSPPWDALARCESGGDWSLDARYDGGLQFDPPTWVAYGGASYAVHAYEATREQQIDVARRVLADRGWGAWPSCARQLGLLR